MSQKLHTQQSENKVRDIYTSRFYDLRFSAQLLAITELYLSVCRTFAATVISPRLPSVGDALNSTDDSSMNQMRRYLATTYTQILSDVVASVPELQLPAASPQVTASVASTTDNATNDTKPMLQRGFSLGGFTGGPPIGQPQVSLAATAPTLTTSDLGWTFIPETDLTNELVWYANRNKKWWFFFFFSFLFFILVA